jgi:hypothetical protein
VPAAFRRDGAVAAAGGGSSGHALFQLVTKVPIVWEKNPDPYTLIGNFNAPPGGTWVDYALTVDVAIDPSAAAMPGAVEAAAMQPCAGAAASQTWRISSGAGTLAAPTALESAAHPGQCLGVTGATLYPGALDVGLQPCAAAPQWSLDGATGQLVRAGGAAPAFCLDVLSSNPNASARVDAYPCKTAGDANQVWQASYPSAGAVVLASTLASPHLCLDLETLPSPEGAPYVAISARIAVYQRNGPPPSGYTLRVGLSPNATAGAPWQLAFAETVLASGTTAAPVLAGTFYAAAVTAKGTTITAAWAGTTLATITGDSKSGYGMAAVGSGWHNAWFDNFAVKAV